MLVLQGMGELVRERHPPRDVELLAAHRDALTLRVVVGEHARLLQVAHRVEEVDTAHDQAHGAELRPAPRQVGFVARTELAAVDRDPRLELGVVEELDAHRVLELESPQLLHPLDDRHQAAYPTRPPRRARPRSRPTRGRRRTPSPPPW